MDFVTSLIEQLKDVIGKVLGYLPDVPIGAILAIVFLGFFVALICISFFRLISPAKPTPESELIKGLRGRLEKNDRVLNELKTEIGRDRHWYKSKISEISDDLHQVQTALKLNKTVKRDGAVDPDHISAPIPLEMGELESKKKTKLDEDLSNLDTDTEEVSSEIPEPLSLDEDASSKVNAGLKATRRGLLSKIKGIFSSKKSLDAEMLDELEAQLVSADIGIETVTNLISHVRKEVEGGEDVNEQSFLVLLKKKMTSILSDAGTTGAINIPSGVKPFVVMLVGVNGAGKTTTIAKLANTYKGQGKKVLLVAADTFRAAAVEQLQHWGKEAGVEVQYGVEGAKPASVVYDAMERAKNDGFDVVLVDTAGRLQNKSHLMQELHGVRNNIVRHIPEAPHEVLLVLDGSVGQNALSQGKEFNTVAKLSGLVVTKLDGTPKGGIVVSLANELKLPVRYIGLGEKISDLKVFVPSDFTEALFDESDYVPEDKDLDDTQVSMTRPRKRVRRQDSGALS